MSGEMTIVGERGPERMTYEGPITFKAYRVSLSENWPGVRHDRRRHYLALGPIEYAVRQWWRVTWRRDDRPATSGAWSL